MPSYEQKTSIPFSQIASESIRGSELVVPVASNSSRKAGERHAVVDSVPMRQEASFAASRVHRSGADVRKSLPPAGPSNRLVTNHDLEKANDDLKAEELAGAIFLRLPKVRAITGLSKSSVYELIRAHSFPAPVQLGPRIVAWVSSEVRQWADERIGRARPLLPGYGERRLPGRTVPAQPQSAKRRA